MDLVLCYEGTETRNVRVLICQNLDAHEYGGSKVYSFATKPHTCLRIESSQSYREVLSVASEEDSS
jgi:hypothetical protein